MAVADAFAGDPVLAPLTRRRPGLRVPGHVDGPELAARAVLGQQISVVRARNLAGRLTEEHGSAVETRIPGLTHLFPTAATLATLRAEQLPMPRARGRALTGLAAALADGDVELDRGADRGAVRESLLALPGIGPWTADYVALRALGDPDVFMATDLGVRHALDRLPAEARDPERWRPWRSYAQMYLWHSLKEEA